MTTTAQGVHSIVRRREFVLPVKDGRLILSWYWGRHQDGRRRISAYLLWVQQGNSSTRRYKPLGSIRISVG